MAVGIAARVARRSPPLRHPAPPACSTTACRRAFMCTGHFPRHGELEVRPIRHRLLDRVRAQVFLADAVLLPQLVPETSPRADPVSRPRRTRRGRPTPQSRSLRPSVPTPRWPRLPANAPPATTPAQLTSLLADLATICANHVQPAHDMPAFTVITTPTPLQRWVFELLGVSRRHGLAQSVHPHHQTTAQHPTRHQTGNFGLTGARRMVERPKSDHNWHSSEAKLTPPVRF